jgi:hypothetical protein
MELRRLLTCQGDDTSAASRSGQVACGIAALLLHGALACALPAASEPSRGSTPPLVWLEAGLGQGSAQRSSASDEAGPLAARSSAPAAPATRSRTRVRAPLRAHARSAAGAQGGLIEEPPSEGRALPQAGPAEACAAQALHTLRAASDGPDVSPQGGAPSDASAGSVAAGRAHAGSQGTGAGPATGRVGHGPGLVTLGSPCASYFPADAHDDQGEVQIDVSVDAAGHTHASTVLAEQPRGQGFGNAAQACVRQLRFAPARAESGAPVAGHATLKLRFRRHSIS